MSEIKPILAGLCCEESVVDTGDFSNDLHLAWMPWVGLDAVTKISIFGKNSLKI